MLHIELVPDLSHCIETVAKKEYEEAVKKLLDIVETNEELEEKAEILRLFLKNANFKKLRVESEKQLMEGRAVQFVVYLEDGIPKYEMKVT
jgi:hypothetical protein